VIYIYGHTIANFPYGLDMKGSPPKGSCVEDMALDGEFKHGEVNGS
jgi:hypothetical protein